MSIHPTRLALALTLIATSAFAQADEVNPAKLIQGKPKATLTPQEVVDLGQDPTPFGVQLKNISVKDTRIKKDALSPALASRLAPLKGQQLSFKLLSEIQASVTNHYRDLGLPLVSVTVPPQEISSGNVKINVTTFVLANKRVEGTSRAPDGFLQSQIRQQKGEQINADRLVEDINWLNLNPFRKVQGIFEPGKDFGTTNVILEVKENRPWSAFAGLSNSGSASTDDMRLFAGFNTAKLPWPDHQLAYQLTISPESLKNGDLFNSGTDEPGYVSHAVTYFAPLSFDNGTRAKLTFQAYRASSYSAPAGLIAAHATTSGISAELAFPLAKRGTDYTFFPEIYGKLDYKKKDEDLFFGGAQVGITKTNTRQLTLGARATTFGELFGKKSKGALDAHLVFGTTDIAGSGQTSSTVLRVNAQQTLGLSDAVSLGFRLTAQASGKALSSLDQFGIGGVGTVRGYNTNEASSNSGLAASVELSGKSIPLSRDGIFPVSVAPYGFFDAGYLRPTSTSSSVALSSIGVGGRFILGKSASAMIEAAQSLRAGPSTRKGNTTIHFNITAQF